MAAEDNSALSIISQPLILPCGLTLPNRLVKCPMQETLAVGPFYDPPTEKFKHLYTRWATASYGLIITGQVQIDFRFLSVPGDVVTHPKSLESPHFEKWQEWARLSKQGVTPSIVQLAHPGRMSPAGAGERDPEMQTWCPSSVPVKLGETWLDKLVLDKMLGTPKEMTLAEIDELVDMFKHAALVSCKAGFDGVQIHGAHGFLVSQFLSPHTNRRTDAYGGSPEKRMKLLKRLVTELRAMCPRPLCLSVKLNSADYMTHSGLEQPEGLEQVKWLVECGMVDLIELSGGNAEAATSKLHNSFGEKSISTAPERSSTRIREAFFTDFAEQVQALQSPVPIQLSGGFRSRTGMADAIDSGVCDLIGLGRTAVLEPDLPKAVLLNPEVTDSNALAISHIIKGQWLARMIPIKVVGSSFTIQYFYHNMRRLGSGLTSDPDLSLPGLLVVQVMDTMRRTFASMVSSLMSAFQEIMRREEIE
jgi:2,4-dienoyl-CoA reductase-like NADH-dependent reductase (Old Yellow Enzyme family)